jgi:hypothetical protein
LAAGAPGGSAAADGFAAEGGFVFGANALGGPALVEEPVFWRVAEGFADFFEGDAGDEADFFVEAGEFGGFKRGGRFVRREGGAPEDFVGHPVADSGKTFLVEERGFEGEAAVALQEIGHGGAGEGARGDGGGDAGPPGGRFGALMDMDAAELARVVEDEGAVFLVEDEVVVLGGRVRGGRDGEFAGHAEVKAEPEIFREAEEHLFAGRFGGDEFLAGEFWEEGEVVAAEDAFVGVEMDAENFGVEAGIPLAAVVIDLGEFGHGRRIAE